MTPPKAHRQPLTDYTANLAQLDVRDCAACHQDHVDVNWGYYGRSQRDAFVCPQTDHIVYIDWQPATDDSLLGTAAHTLPPTYLAEPLT